jgi:hypothetical protein
VLARVHEAERVGREQSIPVFNKVLVAAGEGLALLRKGELQEAICLLERGIEGWRATGGYLKSSLPEMRTRRSVIAPGRQGGEGAIYTGQDGIR